MVMRAVQKPSSWTVTNAICSVFTEGAKTIALQ